MKKLNRRETVILSITLGLITFFIAFECVIKPMHEGSVDINDQLRVDTDRLIKARQMSAQAPQVETSYQNLAELMGGGDSAEAQMPTIVSKIETAARDSNIHIANIQPQKMLIQKETGFLSVELEIDGQWLDIVQFLHSIQQRPDFYFINELNLEKYSDTINSLRGRIVISCMYLVDPK